MLEITLTVQSPEETKQVPVAEGRLTIGRSDKADLCLTDTGLSRLHASIYREGDRVWILDEGSTNGSLVNGQPVPAAGLPLANGDEIRLGNNTVIIVKLVDLEAAQVAASSGGSANQSRRPLVAALSVVFAGLIGIAILLSYLSNKQNAQPPASSISPQPGSGGMSAEGSGSEIDQARSYAVTVSPAPLNSVSPTTPLRKLYLQMTESERVEFIDQRAQHIALMMGNRPYAFTNEVLGYIKAYVNGYAGRANSSSTQLWGEGLRSLYGRATRYAPYIIRAFNARGVPPVVGLYIVMVETEYHECLESPVGAKGLFQFMPETARAYGVDPTDRCKVEKMAPAAAHYMADRIAEFGTDSMSVALGIAGYNRSPDSIRRDLHDVLDPNNKERSFWTLIANKEELDHFFQRENIRYVPKFFAAAIVGETPWAFGLEINPLSTYTEISPRP